MLTQIIICLGVVVVINFLLLIWAFRFLSDVYTTKFDSLLKTFTEATTERDRMIREAFEERDVRFGKLQGMIAQTIVRDTALFDSMLEDTETFAVGQELNNERETDDNDGA